MSIRAIIIDDESDSRDVLSAILTEYCPQITGIYEASDLLSGVKAIKKHRPELVFLDIEMPQHSGLQILEFLDKEDFKFEIVFTTAYSKYAIDAFQVSAIDYLLKPLRPKQVREAITKFENAQGKNQMYDRLLELSTKLKTSLIDKIAVPVSDGVLFMELDQIICLQADRMYTKLNTIDRGELLISKPLKYFESLLKGAESFYRPHRSYLINLKHIKQFIKKDGAYIVMEQDIMVSLSKDKKDEFIKFLNTQQHINI